MQRPHSRPAQPRGRVPMPALQRHPVAHDFARPILCNVPGGAYVYLVTLRRKRITGGRQADAAHLG